MGNDRYPALDGAAPAGEAGEIVVFGTDRPRRPGPVDLLRHHPWLAVPVALAVVVGGAIVVRANAPTPLRTPRLVTASAIGIADLSPDEAPWTAGPGGRPGPVVITTPVHLRFEPVDGTTVTVLGMDGAGLSPVEGPGAHVDPTVGPFTTYLGTRVACDTAITPTNNTLRIRVSDGTREAVRRVAAPQLGAAVARQVRTACASWLARRDLTVTDLSARVDPRRPKVNIGVTIVNAGARDATAALALPTAYDSSTISATPTGPLTIPAHGSAQLSLAVGLGSCDEVAVQPSATASGTSDTQPVLRLFSNIGAPVGADAGQAFYSGGGPTGIVLAPDAGRRLDSALRQACGDLTGFAALIAPHGVTYAPATRRLSIRLQLDGTPGKVGSLTLVSDRANGFPETFTPLWRTRTGLVPDATGQATTTLVFRARRADVCTHGAVTIPGFSIVARVPTATATRTLHFVGFGVPWQESVVLDAVCAAERRATRA